MTETNECAVFVPGQVKKDPKNKKDMQELHILCILSIRVAGTMGFLLSRLAFARLLRNRPPSLGPVALGSASNPSARCQKKETTYLNVVS